MAPQQPNGHFGDLRVTLTLQQLQDIIAAAGTKYVIHPDESHRIWQLIRSHLAGTIFAERSQIKDALTRLAKQQAWWRGGGDYFQRRQDGFETAMNQIYYTLIDLAGRNPTIEAVIDNLCVKMEEYLTMNRAGYQEPKHLEFYYGFLKGIEMFAQLYLPEGTAVHTGIALNWAKLSELMQPVMA